MSSGWDIRLVDKPLHGTQDEPLEVVEDVRQQVGAVRGQHEGDFGARAQLEERILEPLAAVGGADAVVLGVD